MNTLSFTEQRGVLGASCWELQAPPGLLTFNVAHDAWHREVYYNFVYVTLSVTL